MLTPELKAKIEKAAKTYAHHEDTCTCKGQHFSKDKCTAFTAGAEFMEPLARREGFMMAVEILKGDPAKLLLEFKGKELGILE